MLLKCINVTLSCHNETNFPRKSTLRDDWRKVPGEPSEDSYRMKPRDAVITDNEKLMKHENGNGVIPVLLDVKTDRKSVV